MRITVAISMIACALLVAGCSSTPKDDSAPWVAVLIEGNTPGQIRDMAGIVFREKGYLVTRTGAGDLLCEKKAGKMSNLAYGSWLGDDPVWERAKVTVVPVGEMTCRLECKACLVTDRGGPIEEEIKTGKLRRAPYEALLKEVAQRFQAPAGTDSAGSESLQPALQ